MDGEIIDLELYYESGFGTRSTQNLSVAIGTQKQSVAIDTIKASKTRTTKSCKDVFRSTRTQ